MNTSCHVPEASVEALYHYRPLSDSDEIRLATLFPGAFHDPIQLHISHVHHAVHAQQYNTKISITDLKGTLPNNWEVHETTENQVFFYYEDDDGSNWKASWEHPDPSIDSSLYTIPGNDTELDSHSLRYEALSYTWGSIQDSEAALITDDTSAAFATLPIGLNLSSALRHLRYKDRSRALWVDAICINQSDMSERATQVKRMADIYQQASRVVVWLGPDDDSSALAIKTLDYLGRQVVTTKDSWIFCTPDSEEPYWCEASCKLPYSKETWEAISTLLARSWFERVWVIQEIQLANHHALIQCGTHEISWSNFRKAMVTLWNKNNMPSILPRSKLAFVEELTKNLKQASSLQILRLARNRRCNDPRDLIFALMGLFPRSFSEVLSPSYSATVDEVYKDVTIGHIGHAKRLDLLRNCNLTAPSQDKLISWVPDFSASWSWPKPIESQFAAGYSASIAKLLNSSTIEVMGVFCTIIKDVMPITSIPCLSHEGQYKVTNSVNDRASHKASDTHQPTSSEEGTYHNGEPLCDVYTKITAGNYLRERFPANNVPTLNEWASHLATHDLGISQAEHGNSVIGLSSFHEDYSRDLLRQRTFIRTTEGYLGLGPTDAHQGDVIVVLLGCDSPMALRPDSGTKYRVVGECYVYGLENARALLGPLEDHWTVQVLSEHRREYKFLNTETGVLTDDDPRLPSLEKNWERIMDIETTSGPTTFQLYKNKETGEIINYDPRMTLETFESKGITVENFALI
ncbi:heterokaryon incompatibility protein-domain-containing protein [Xylariaceae sp. FL1651]|nr:heterokaryon incompatibility protein-domain-containing protein [Xylariaceae sp. FL1651]